MNPELIKRGLDNEEYANACPTVGALLLAHYSSKEAHREDLYNADAQFFEWYPERRIYLRPALSGEFDIEDDPKRPTLWVRVHQISPGFHEILPVYRGSAFWRGADAATDEGVGKLCYQFALRNGMHLSEWYGYVTDQRVLKANKTSSIAKKQVIH